MTFYYLYRMASPRHFYRFSGQLLPWLSCFGLALLSYGLYAGLVLAPPDKVQGDAYRIIYIHVPCAFLSLSIYSVMAVMAFIYLIWRIKLADVLLKACVPLGAMFTALALISGALWGKPMWGTWWIWDARLTSELILLFLYFGVMGLQAAFYLGRAEQGAQLAAILTLVGSVNIPIIHYSVTWWQTLHQGATLSLMSQSAIDASMLQPLLITLSGFIMYSAVIILLRARREILLREQHCEWVRDLP